LSIITVRIARNLFHLFGSELDYME